MIRTFIAAATAALLATSAQAQIPEPLASTKLPNVDRATLVPVLQQMGLRPETVTLESGEALAITTPSMTVILRPRVCNPDCAGLFMLSIVPDSGTADQINAYNSFVPGSKAVRLPNGSTAISRYLIADYGLIAGSFLIDLQVFANTVGRWQQRNFPMGSNVQSVSLTEPGESQFDSEMQDLLDDVLERPELWSREVGHSKFDGIFPQ
ncbi:hypothetical protein [Parvularcula lutaonensis]|uniref:YbjN domain-containing protein n=1 Tax=Parvularcula lutaonensis TaxID=491923 RepID=A0ABV7MCT9_9PROT|nr:hypothetical protein [Parvularcula lutaonensis]GGY40032.1 hypothetical protein GCM10007148_05600 [Parvularcula lutaonensis]